MSGLRVGDFVRFAGSPGVGRVAAVEGENVQVGFFESIAEPVAQTQRIAARLCTPVSLAGQVAAAQSGWILPCPEASLPAAPGSKSHGQVGAFSTALPSRKSAGNTLGLLSRTRLPVLPLCTAGREGVAA